MSDFKREAMNQRYKVLQAAKAQVAANISNYEASGDTDSAADEIQAYSNLESEEQNLVASYQRHLAPRPPAPPETEGEWRSKSPERMTEHDVDKIFSRSKYYTRDQWSDPTVAEGVRRGLIEVQNRK